MPSAPTRNSDSATSSDSQLPRIGRPNSTIDARMMSAADASEITKYGIVLPTTNENVSIGAMRTCSIVPRSFSRTIESAVEVDRGDHRDVGDQPGHEEQRAAQLGVVPDARLDGDAAAATWTLPGASCAPTRAQDAAA